MAVIVQQVQDCHFITAIGCFNGDDCRQLRQVIADAKDQHIRHVLVDCERITSVTTEALRIVLSQTTHAEATGINLLFYHVNTKTQEIIDKTGLDSVLHIVLSLKEAYQYCKQHT
ncbi:anti-sigma factor antagonist [Pontibacter diazotrophicus]|uniref:Anti-sigma factor antagonist n=1 Tax=Pontibacter diazotrophicus TaxID=1400979 RepID=A0A3D8LHJ4_9BACT|nr:STAS domain-containing protein [Pontibacter diazotrophicus]RDV16818.1 anti-sigma factor antagonist [Pontibacter diazotrophicus]